MSLSGSVVAEFRAALEGAFTRADITMMLRTCLERNWTSYTSAADTYPKQLHDLIEAADVGGWAQQLLFAAVRANPGNTTLAEFANANLASMAPAPSPAPVPSEQAVTVAAPNPPEAYRQLITTGLPTGTRLQDIIQTLSDKLKVHDPPTGLLRLTLSWAPGCSTRTTPRHCRW